jgi:hypothetical protein
MLTPQWTGFDYFGSCIEMGKDYMFAARMPFNSDFFVEVYRLGPSLPTEPPVGQATSVEVSPNPARGPATVSLSVLMTHHVRVTVTDVLGRLVRVLHDGALAAGRHALTVPSHALTGGVYLITVEGDGYRSAVPLTITR